MLHWFLCHSCKTNRQEHYQNQSGMCSALTSHTLISVMISPLKTLHKGSQQSILSKRLRSLATNASWTPNYPYIRVQLLHNCSRGILYIRGETNQQRVVPHYAIFPLPLKSHSSRVNPQLITSHPLVSNPFFCSPPEVISPTPLEVFYSSCNTDDNNSTMSFKP